LWFKEGWFSSLFKDELIECIFPILSVVISKQRSTLRGKQPGNLEPQRSKISSWIFSKEKRFLVSAEIV